MLDGNKMRIKQIPPRPKFDLTGGHMCLDLANTVDMRLSGRPIDKLKGYEELIAFGQQAGVFSFSDAQKLQRQGRKDRSQASRLFQRVVALRETTFRILSAAATRHQVSEADVRAINAELQRLSSSSVVAPVKGQVGWCWVEKSNGVGRLVGSVVRSVVEVLTSEDIQRLRQCAAENCGWLFIDHSRSHNRRWCEMRTCGSQHKARAYYQRKTAGLKRRNLPRCLPSGSLKPA